jgi:glycosyltransferase involved in cell wall biosynthesis
VAFGGFMMRRVSALPGNSTPRVQGVVLAHDWLVGMRGGEWVLDRLARLFGPTDLYTLVNDGGFLTDAIARCNVITSPLQRLPGASGRARRWYLPLMPWAVERLRVRRDAQLVVSTSSAVMKSITPPAGVPHLCYCHSPARYIWEQTDEYSSGSRGWLRASGLRAVRRRFQEWDRRTASEGRVTKFIANSQHTANRIERCYSRASKVIYPPVRTEFFTPDASIAREEWLLVVAALEPYKRTDIVVDAARRAGWRLKVVGSGSQLKSLRKSARAAGSKSSDIELFGRVDDAALRDMYRRARALVFPQVEDFGIIAAEAQSCGCPVIAYGGAGGAVEIVTNQTGVFMEEQSADAVIAAVGDLARHTIDPDTCRTNALRFSEARFDHEIRREVDAILGGSIAHARR